MRGEDAVANGPTPAVRLTGVSFRFQRSSPVLRGVDLSVGRGELVVVHGDNGAGKSTLLRLVAGVLFPTGGRCQRVRSVGYVPQRGDDPPPGISVRDWLRAVAAMSGRPVGEALLDALGVGSSRARLDTLSRGTVAKVMLAAALGGQPDLLVLDEPLAALDAASRHNAVALIRARAAEGSGVLLAEHERDSDLGDCRTVTVRGGRLVEGKSRMPVSFRLVLRGVDGENREQIVAEPDRDALLLDALSRGEQVLRVEPL